MTMLTLLGSSPVSLSFALSSGVIDLMLFTLAVSGLGVAGVALSGWWRSARMKTRRSSRFLTAVRHPMPA
jgi:hypothetical protein